MGVLRLLIGLQAGGLAGLLVRTVPYFRDRILADNLFLFKIGAEVLIDSGALASLSATACWRKGAGKARDRQTPQGQRECSWRAGCATVAEVRKRGDDFWAEFEFYLSDLVVGLVSTTSCWGVVGGVQCTRPA